MQRKIKLLIADDQAILIGGMELLLAKAGPYEIVGSVQILDDILPEYIRTKPDVVICDIRFKEKSNELKNGLEVVEQLLAFDKNAKVIVHSQYDDGECIHSAYFRGAKSFLSKDAELQSMLTAINEVASGNLHVPDAIAKKLALFSISKSKEQKSFHDFFSKRQLEIFVLIAKGKTQEEIASILQIHKRTVTAETKILKDQLGIDRPAEFTMLAIEHGFISSSSDFTD